jgi:hypothetical protein
VANKQVNGKQLTVAFHVDDLKVSHDGSKVIDDFWEWIQKLYEDPSIKKIEAFKRQGTQLLGHDIGLFNSGKGKTVYKRYFHQNVG